MCDSIKLEIELSGGFLAKNWEVFYQDDNIDSIEEVITGYIHFCMDTVVPKKTIKIYPNNKEYIFILKLNIVFLLRIIIQ